MQLHTDMCKLQYDKAWLVRVRTCRNELVLWLGKFVAGPNSQLHCRGSGRGRKRNEGEGRKEGEVNGKGKGRETASCVDCWKTWRRIIAVTCTSCDLHLRWHGSYSLQQRKSFVALVSAAAAACTCAVCSIGYVWFEAIDVTESFNHGLLCDLTQTSCNDDELWVSNCNGRKSAASPSKLSPFKSSKLPIASERWNSHKYVCITTYQQDTKSNPNPNPYPTTEQHAVANIQLNIVTCPTYPDIHSYETCCCTVCATLGCNYHTA